MANVYYIGLDVHKKKISYCVKDVSGRIYSGGFVAATRMEPDQWMKTLPQPWTAAPTCNCHHGLVAGLRLSRLGDCVAEVGDKMCLTLMGDHVKQHMQSVTSQLVIDCQGSSFLVLDSSLREIRYGEPATMAE